MNDRNDLDECLTYFELLFYVPDFRILFLWVAYLTFIFQFIR